MIVLFWNFIDILVRGPYILLGKKGFCLSGLNMPDSSEGIGSLKIKKANTKLFAQRIIFLNFGRQKNSIISVMLSWLRLMVNIKYMCQTDV